MQSCLSWTIRSLVTYLSVVLLFFFVTGCTQMTYYRKAVFGGATLGAGLGTLIGGIGASQAEGKNRVNVGSLIGAASGTVVGGVLGYLLSRKSTIIAPIAQPPSEKLEPEPLKQEVVTAPLLPKPHPVPPRVEIPPAQPKLEMTIVLDDLLFDFDKTVIKPGGTTILDRLITSLNEYPDWRVVLEGHADLIGTVKYNQGLSERRALMVRNYLVKMGIDPSRITSLGFGETRPNSDNRRREGRARNRRVEVKVR